MNQRQIRERVATILVRGQSASIHEEGLRELLDLVCAVAGADNSGSLLWLYDAPRRSLHLAVSSKSLTSYQELEGWHVSVGEAADSVETTGQSWPESLANHAHIKELASARRYKHQRTLALVPMSSLATGAMPPLGTLHILSRKRPNKRALGLFRFIAEALTYAIALQRRERVRVTEGALRQLQDSPVDHTAILNDAASSIRAAVRAQACVIYGQIADMSLRATGASDREFLAAHTARRDSLTSHVLTAKRVVRLANFHDDGERQRAFGTLTFDEQQDAEFHRVLGTRCRAWMCAPVIVDEHGFALVKVVNKQGALLRQFTSADETLLVGACRVLAQVLPRRTAHHALVRISETILPGDFRDAVAEGVIFDLLQEVIPGLVAAGIVEYSQALRRYSAQRLGGRGWFASTQVDLRPRNGVTPLTDGDTTETPARYKFFQEVPHVQDCHIVLGLHRDYLRKYEEQLVRFVAMEIGQLLRTEKHIRASVDNLIQIRHNIRSGLMGVEGHLHTAISMYSIYKKTGAATLSTARFRKALDWARHFAKRTNALMEEARFLLGNIHESMQIERVSIASIVREQVECLAPAARRKHLTIGVRSTIPPHQEEIEGDAQMLSILFFNLLENAVKYSKHGYNIEVQLACKRSEWIVTVQNVGHFVRSVDMKAVFQAFERVPTGDPEMTMPGTGLGLAVAREIIGAHGGTVDLDSAALSRKRIGQTRVTVRAPRTLEKRL